MRETHNLHRMLFDTTPGARRPMLPFDVVPRTRNCDDASPYREYKRRKIDTNGNGEEVYISHPGSSHDALARPALLTVPDSPLHPPSPCPPTVPSASTPRCTFPTRVRTTMAHSAPRSTSPTGPVPRRSSRWACARPRTRARIQPPAAIQALALAPAPAPALAR
ncbi:hypothetical protein B0H13DRAFT_1007595 [Mycena leptocephala]|nr:hypothetical protein B0H13DRAFT_1007595 [Mycena leptocephala]